MMTCCKCGYALVNVPEHLKEIVGWLCHRCTAPTNDQKRYMAKAAKLAREQYSKIVIVPTEDAHIERRVA